MTTNKCNLARTENLNKEEVPHALFKNKTRGLQ